jgi:hypothetical protein
MVDSSYKRDPLAAASEGSTAADLLTASLSRRSLLKRGALGAGAVLGGSSLLSAITAEAARAQSGLSVLSEPANDITPFAQIFQIAEIAEQLAVTFYSNGVANAGTLGLSGPELDAIKAAGIEEQIHHDFFAVITGTNPIAPTTFSFPAGSKTFSDLATFIFTQQALELVFDSAFLAAVRELSHQDAHRAAQIAAQVACVEAEHRALGREILTRHGITTMQAPMVALGAGDILNPPPTPTVPATITTSPADNLAFAPVFFDAVGDAPATVAAAGFLSATAGNSYSYQPIDFKSPTYNTVFANIYFQTPTINVSSQPTTPSM